MQKIMKELSCIIKGADVAVGRTQFVWETENKYNIKVGLMKQ
jgi:hypothetical protein